MTQEDIRELYESNEEFRDYVDRFIRVKPISVQQALEYKVVQLVAENMTKSVEQ